MYKYDAKGNLLEEEWYDNNPNENSKKTYHYSDKGILEKVDVYYEVKNLKTARDENLVITFSFRNN